MTASQMIRLAALLGAVTVALGAFGAHGLKPHLDAYQQDIYAKAVHYQFVHLLAILICGVLSVLFPENRRFGTSAWLFFIGILCFSGSLYLLATRHLLPFGVGWAGPVTPIGGVSFIAGWLWLAFSGRK